MPAIAQNQTPDLETHAALFLRDVRDIFQNSGKSLRGSASLQKKDLTLIYETSAKAVRFASEFNTQGLVTPLAKLMERLEEGCRRNKILVDPALRPALAQILLLELCDNICAFGFEKKPEKMIPLTLYQGREFSSVKTEAEFADFADSPSLFKHAAVHNPKDPRKFLREVRDGKKPMPNGSGFFVPPAPQ